MAPERLLVFELRGPVTAFAAAARKVPGLELIDEEELEPGESDEKRVLYLMVPDAQALRELESYWRRYLADQLVHGETPWRDVFSLLKDLRPWGPHDRVRPDEADLLSGEIAGLGDAEPVRLEVELVFRGDARVGELQELALERFVGAQSGRVLARVRIEEIAYHALLVELPVHVVRQIVDRLPDGIAGLDEVLHIRPQSELAGIEVDDRAELRATRRPPRLGPPILALLDGVPVAAHPLLAEHITVDDQFGLEPSALVADREHGTAMASLVIHGDLNRDEQPLPRRVHLVPVLGAKDSFPSDRLVVDLIYSAVVAMREGAAATAPEVVIVNLSLGNRRRPFHGQLSPWARLLDRLAHRFGLLFIVSAGNCLDPLCIEAFANTTAFEDASEEDRAAETLRALGNVMGERRLFSPAETVNGLTIGALNEDAVPEKHRASARINVDPYGPRRMPNPSSTLGPGFARSVKPDLLLPGGREHLRPMRSGEVLEVSPGRANRFAGLSVAAPPRDGFGNGMGFTGGTSAAAALASRTAHQIHDALEAAYGDAFLQLPHEQRAVLLKALLAHSARWPEEAAELIRGVIGPTSSKQHVQRKDNIRRFLGFGAVNAEEAVACAVDRAVFWATGTLPPNRAAVVAVPLPVAIGAKALPHAFAVTLAWFTPTRPGRQSYRAVRLKLLDPSSLGELGVDLLGDQPDANMARRGTLFTRCWSGSRAPVVGSNAAIELTVQREPDQGPVIDDAISFGLAVTLAMPGVVELYEQVRQRLAIAERAPV